MENLLSNFIKKNDIFNVNSDKILLTVSGGIDSVVLCELFVKLKIKFGIAHCNFKLRNSESDNDEKHVRHIANQKDVPFHSISFQTSDYASKKGISIEMAARKLRYEWFEKIRIEHNYKYIATGHHIDDQIETAIFNLSRGTGIAGLHGINTKQNNIIRPLLFASRKDIEEYASSLNISYRNDSSNNDTKYIRNKIRHEIIPRFKEINPSFNKTMNENIERIKGVENIYRMKIEEERKKIITHKNDNLLLSIQKIKDLQSGKIFLYEFLVPYNFNASTTEDIYNSLNEISGKEFYSKTHRLVKDRDSLIITKINKNENNLFFIDEFADFINIPIKLSISKIDNNKNYKIEKNSHIGTFDFSKLSFPLIIRKWQKGDSFYPLGMKTKKKISDFFIDEKFSIIDKENTWLLCNNNEIIWIIGHRIDNRYKITKTTRKILKLKIDNNFRVNLKFNYF